MLGGVFEPVEPPIEKPETPTTPPSTEDLLTIKIEENIMAVVGTNDWNAIAYGNGKYVAVGTNGYATTSTDGINWTTPKQRGSATWFNVVHGGGNRFVAIGTNAVLVLNDIDNTNSWRVYTGTVSGIDANTHSLAYGNNVFITGKDIGYIQFTNDGANWSKFQLGSIRGIPLQIIYAGDKFRLVSSDGYYAEAITGMNRENWNEYKLTIDAFDKTYCPYKMAYANNTVILAGRMNKIYHIDISSKVVTSIQIGGATSIYDSCANVFFVNDRFVAIFSTYKFNDNDTYIATYSTSLDGLNWTSLKPIQDENMNTINVRAYGAMVIR